MEKFYEPGFIAGATSLLVASVVAIYLWKKLKQADIELKDSQAKVVNVSTVLTKSKKKIEELSARVKFLEERLSISSDVKKSKKVSFKDQKNPKKKKKELEEPKEPEELEEPEKPNDSDTSDDSGDEGDKGEKDDEDTEDDEDVDNDFDHVTQ